MHEPGQDLRQLLKRYQAGDQAAPEELYRRTCQRVLAYLSSRLRNPSIAEDLLQETFLQLHRSRHTYQQGRPVLPWMIGIARHVILMHRRFQERRPRIVAGCDDGDLPEVPVPAAPEGLADKELLEGALGRLSSDQREALILHYVAGFTYREIGTRMGLLSGTVKLRAFRGLRELRRVLRLNGRGGSGPAGGSSEC